MFIPRKTGTCSFMVFFFLHSLMHASKHAGKKYCKTACISLPEDEHLEVRNMSKTLKLNQNTDVKSVNFVGLITQV